MTYEEARAKAYEVTHFPLSIKILDNCKDLVWVVGNSPFANEGLYTLHPNYSAGCCSQTEAILLNQITKILKPVVTVEIGSYIGWSTIHLAEHSRHVIAVDDFSEGSAREVFLENVRLSGFNNISLIEQSSDNYFVSAVPGLADIIFIDGYHHNGQPLKDVLGALKHIDHKGWIILHDTWERDVATAKVELLLQGYYDYTFETDNRLAIYHKDSELLEWLIEKLQS